MSQNEANCSLSESWNSLFISLQKVMHVGDRRGLFVRTGGEKNTVIAGVLSCLWLSEEQKMVVFVAHNWPVSETTPRSTWWGSSATLKLDSQVNFTPEIQSLEGKVRQKGGTASSLSKEQEVEKNWMLEPVPYIEAHKVVGTALV